MRNWTKTRLGTASDDSSCGDYSHSITSAVRDGSRASMACESRAKAAKVNSIGSKQREPALVRGTIGKDCQSLSLGHADVVFVAAGEDNRKPATAAHSRGGTIVRANQMVCPDFLISWNGTESVPYKFRASLQQPWPVWLFASCRLGTAHGVCLLLRSRFAVRSRAAEW
jgi:hypothetical protein